MRPDLPTGTVTFLFTDVEGSTRLLHKVGAEAYAKALAEHRRVIREACSANAGVEVDTQGDAFFFAFPSAPAALGAAETLVEGLASGAVQVRVGLHTGTPLVTEEGYVGGDVHRAARIAAAGHGGQVLVSASTASLVDYELRDLGEHRFKDLSAPERVYQQGEGDFPALKSLYRTNLPVPATPFLGRQRELHEVVSLLCADDVRLLTLTGPGGTGKTRLALQAAADAAERFPDGITWVPLAPLRDPSLLLSTIAQALDVREEPGEPLVAALIDFLKAKKLLVLLDNVEHLLPDAAGDLAHLSSTPGPFMLVTSRERLQLQGEQLYPVPTLLESDGVELFIARARALEPGFDGNGAIGDLCSRLDNLPLALELAAARTTLFSPVQLLERLSHRLDLLKGGRDADPRQQTLRATIEWSYDLLDSDEQRLFRSLSVFAGGCTFEAAEEVCRADPDTLQSLLDKSLLRRLDSELGSRYWMLETVRDFASEQLAASGELSSYATGTWSGPQWRHLRRLGQRETTSLKRLRSCGSSRRTYERACTGLSRAAQLSRGTGSLQERGSTGLRAGSRQKGTIGRCRSLRFRPHRPSSMQTHSRSPVSLPASGAITRVPYLSRSVQSQYSRSWVPRKTVSRDCSLRHTRMSAASSPVLAISTKRPSTRRPRSRSGVD